MTHAHLALIRFVTARQADLRGLREVTFAVFVCAAISIILWRLEAGRPNAWLVLVVLGIFVQEGALRRVDRRYNAAYGRVDHDKRRPKRTTTAQTLLFTGLALDIFTPWFPFAGFSAFPLVVAVHGLRIVFRDFPWRVYYLAAVALLFVVPGLDDPLRGVSYLPQYFAAASILLLTGLLDHLLLAGSMVWLKAAPPLEGPLPVPDKR